MKAEEVRKILLSDNLKLTALELNIEYPWIRGIQIQWLRRIKGKCVLCSAVCEERLCSNCKKWYGDPVLLAPAEVSKVFMFLEQIPKHRALLRLECARCKKEHYLSAEKTVTMYKKYGTRFFRKKWYCPSCWKTGRGKYEDSLKHRPFEGIKGKIPR